MKLRTPLRWYETALAFAALAAGCSAFAQELPREVKQVFATFNEEKIQFREEPLIIGSDQAKLTAVLFYAQACTDSEEFIRNAFPEIKKKYIDTNKLRLIVHEYPLNWRDIQLLAGLRCLPADKQLEAMVDAASRRLANIFRKSTFTNAPGFFTSTLTKFGLSEDQANKCMRNVEIIGHIEGLRKLAVEQWNITSTPTLLIGTATYTGLTNPALISEILEKHLK